MAGLLDSLYGFLTGGGSSGKAVRGVDPDHVIGRDVAIEEDLTVFDSEKLQLNERGGVVGLTAIIGKEGLGLRDSKVPEGQIHSLPHRF